VRPCPKRLRDKRGKVKAIKFDAHCGDVTATHPMGNLLAALFVMECKHYADLDVECLYFRNRGKLLQFWHKVKGEAFDSEREPLMIVRQNRFPDVLITTLTGVNTLGLAKRDALNHHPAFGMWVYSFKQVLEVVDFDAVRRQHQHPEIIKDLFKERRRG
jgi:hypothetical protein